MEKAELIQIIQKSKDGDMEAMEKLLLHAHTSVSYQCRKMLKSEQDVEDMTQEILVTVYQKLDSLQEPAAFNQWLKKITAARCINALTRTHVEYQFAEDEEGHSILDTLEEMDEKKIPDQWLDNKETTRMIEDIVNGLPEAQRLCTLMFYYSEMSVKEMSHVLKVSENTVKSRLNYARKAIKEKVLDYEKQGIKLYGISPLPFLFYFLHKLEKESKNPAVAQVMVDEILAESTMVAAAGAVAAGSAGAAATGTAAATAASVTGAATTASGGLLAMLSAIPLKVVAGVTAAAITVGGIAAATTMVHKEQTDTPAATIVQEEQLESERNDDRIIVHEETGAEDDFVSNTEESMPEATKGASENEQSASNGNTSTDSSDGTSADSEGSGNNGSSNEGNTNMDSGENSSGTDSSEDESDDSNSSDSSETLDLTVHTHKYDVIGSVDACCVETGFTEYRCSVCGSTYTDEIGKSAHNYDKMTVVSPTAYSQGYTMYECTTTCEHDHPDGSYNCSATYVTDYTDKLSLDSDTTGCAHDFYSGDVIRKATCYTEGVQEYKCIHCGYSYTEIIPVYEEHSWRITATQNPFCEIDGYDAYVCSYCLEEKKENVIPATGHDYITTIVAPTETEKGYTEFVCTHCGNAFIDNYTAFSEDDSVAEHAHSYDIPYEVAATCTATGESGYECACGLRDSDIVIIPSIGHDYQSNHLSCTESGTVLTVCSNCGDSYSHEKAAYDHYYEGVVVEASDLEEGYTQYTCKHCGETYRDEYHTHDWSEFLIQHPGCTDQGYHAKECYICKAKEILYYTDPRGHTWNEWEEVVAPTEESEGLMTRNCSSCTASESQTIPKIQAGHTHSYQESVTQESTCCSFGTVTYSCECGNTYSENLPYNDNHNYAIVEYSDYVSLHCTICGMPKSVDDMPHRYNSTVIEPTCSDNGYTIYTCFQCGDYFTADETNPFGHSYESTVVEPTETAQGYTDHICSVCGDTYRDSYTDPLGVIDQVSETNNLLLVVTPVEEHSHSYTSSVTASTCTTDGYTTYSCTCGDTYTSDETEALGHSYQSEVVEPTETEEGYTEYVCSICGDTYRDSYTDVTETE